ncbi:MAG: carboxypeptidase-like regulatory domain-containing protein, partial [Fimbriimonadaceae bacterium]
MFLEKFKESFRNNFAAVVMAAVAVWGFTPGAMAQQANDAVVLGNVLDASQASVSGATVRLTHVATNGVTEVRTDDRGAYRTPPLRIGEYTVSVEASGFKKYNQRGIVLSIGDIRKVDAVLEVGQLSESVSVEAEAPLLQTVDSTVGTVINNKQIGDLPLNGRDYLQLAALSSGTIASSQGVGIGGQSGSQAAFLLDGAD